MGEEEEEEQQSQQYQMILGYLEMENKNFFKLEAESKLNVITLLISEHLASDELKDFQINFETHLKNNKKDLKSEKAELVELQKQLVEMNNENPDNPENPENQTYRSKRI